MFELTNLTFSLPYLYDNSKREENGLYLVLFKVSKSKGDINAEATEIEKWHGTDKHDWLQQNQMSFPELEMISIPTSYSWENLRLSFALRRSMWSASSEMGTGGWLAMPAEHSEKQWDVVLILTLCNWTILEEKIKSCSLWGGVV